MLALHVQNPTDISHDVRQDDKYFERKGTYTGQGDERDKIHRGRSVNGNTVMILEEDIITGTTKNKVISRDRTGHIDDIINIFRVGSQRTTETRRSYISVNLLCLLVKKHEI